MDPFEGEVSVSPVAYEPTTVKDVLVEMKDTAELLIDLSYSAVLFENRDLAAEVLRLEERMDVLEMRARMQLMMAARSPEDAEALAPVMSIVHAADAISDAAGDIAKVLLEDIGLPEAMRAALPEAVESLVQATIAADSEYAGRSLADVDLESRTGVRVIALRRDEEWLLNPGPETHVEAADVAFLRGPEGNVGEVVEALSGEPYEPPADADPAIADLERAVDTIVHMKNLSELAVDLAYGSLLFESEALAREVRNLEIEVDALEDRFGAWTLRAAADAEDPVVLRGLIQLGAATETISDAAVEISEGVLRDVGSHPVVHLAVEESDEIITRREVAAGSDLDGVTFTDGIPDTETTMSVIAIRRPEEGWLLVGETDLQVRAGDVLIAKGTRTAAAEFAALTDA